MTNELVLCCFVRVVVPIHLALKEEGQKWGVAGWGGVRWSGVVWCGAMWCGLRSDGVGCSEVMLWHGVWCCGMLWWVWCGDLGKGAWTWVTAFEF